MAYKAPSGLSSAVRGRSMVTRDYTAGVRFKAQERRADEAVTTAGLGIGQGVAGGVAQLTGAIESNIKSHELAAEGAMSIFESSPEAQAGMTFEESGFQSAEGWRDRWFKSAAEVSETAAIGGGTFDTSKLIELGRLSPVARSKAAGRSLDKHGQPTGEYKSLYEEFRMQEPLGRNITPSSNITTNKDAQPGGASRWDRQQQDSSSTTSEVTTGDGTQASATTQEIADVETNVLPGETQGAYNRRLESIGKNPKEYSFMEGGIKQILSK